MGTFWQLLLESSWGYFVLQKRPQLPVMQRVRRLLRLFVKFAPEHAAAKALQPFLNLLDLSRSIRLFEV